ncbi:endonuclease/exonuclease/phosphatase family protein [Rubripirellula obstinata]|uniref:endonuclease/exonuclease/phosphatase family protein n=1 Tax=Rubripirellula obstinata TaxID=406547 RepID=UPI001F169EE7|nr:endonuclease/exonuclease/phosphatase family protein [Rubripirellula obstinata]
MLRWLGPSFTFSGIVGLLFMVVTGRIDLSVFDQWMGNGENPIGELIADSGQPQRSRIEPVALQMDNRSRETIRIATFNIQFFGPSKVSNPQIMQSIARIVSQFDVVAIQEIRNGQVSPIGELVSLLRASGASYSSSVSESIGEGDRYKEAYAFVYDQSRIAMIPGSAYVVQDPDELMSREPMVASFETRTGSPDGRPPFRFTLINVHTSPSEVAENAIINEMNVLDDVFTSVRNYEYGMTGEEDFILLGDLNVDTAGLRELGQIPSVFSIAGDAMTNTRRTKTYDHILIDRNMTTEFTGRYGILDLQNTFGISEEEALKISDHFPVWAEFTIYEAPRLTPQVPPIATRNQTRDQASGTRY